MVIKFVWWCLLRIYFCLLSCVFPPVLSYLSMYYPLPNFPSDLHFCFYWLTFCLLLYLSFVDITIYRLPYILPFVFPLLLFYMLWSMCLTFIVVFPIDHFFVSFPGFHFPTSSASSYFFLFVLRLNSCLVSG